MSLIQMRRTMRNVVPFLVWGFVGIFVVTAFFTFNPGLNSAGAGGSRGTFARINGQEVSAAEFANSVQRMREQYRQFASPGQPLGLETQTQIPGQVYEQILQEYAQAEAARASGVSVSESEAQADATRRVNEMLEARLEGLPEAEKAQYRQAVLGNIDAKSEQRRLLSERLREKLTKEARPVEVRVAHVLIKTGTRTDAAAQKLAQDVARRARAGEDFAKLVQTHSEDLGSKSQGGVVGWASGNPPAAPTDGKTKPNPNDASNFHPEFTGAALRLRKGQISDPVRTTDGYHVIKVVEERPYQPRDAESLKDPKKRDQAIQQYQSQAANAIMNGLFSEYRQKARVEPQSAWLKGYLKEQELNSSPTPPGRDGKTPGEKERWQPVIAAYQEALDKGEPGVGGVPLAYKLAQLYQRTDQHPKALDVLQKYASGTSGDPELFFAKGESLEKLKRKTDALNAYKSALENSFNDAGLLSRLAEKLKELGRGDLAQQARVKQTEALAKQATAEKERQAAMQRMMAEQAQKAAPKKDQKAAGKPQDGEVVEEVTVRTGDIDKKTGKPKILSVERSGDKDKKPAATDKKGPEKP
jgi:parvulin-like peptidyl-prolyl isomerase